MQASGTPLAHGILAAMISIAKIVAFSNFLQICGATNQGLNLNVAINI